MVRNNSFLRFLAVTTLAAALLSARTSQAAELGTLMLDGKVDVEEGGLNGTTVTVFRDDVRTEQLGEGLYHFALEMELGHTYLLSFAKPGCVTKELLFDARTPKVAEGSQFIFLFHVTLTPRNGDFAYDAPVAMIHYDADSQEFGYDRTHAQPRLVPSSLKKAEPHARKQVRPFQDPTTGLAAWVEAKRPAQ